MRTNPKCLECGKRAKLVRGAAIYPHRPDLFDGFYYLCECGAYSGCHKGTQNAKGAPCGPRTRAARKRAHEAFDPLWEYGAMPRAEAYQWLAEALGMHKAECHIGFMGWQDAERVVAAVRARSAAR
jgi:hypothetical protein